MTPNHSSNAQIPTSELVRTLASAADLYGRRGLAVCPLTLDEDGLPKKPLSPTYPRFGPEDNLTHDWTPAAGLGIVLGPASGNMALFDVDDLGLSGFLRRHLVEQAAAPLMAETVRGRLHIYLVEPEPSPSIDLEVQFGNKKCLVQVLAGGCQAAAPPTPGYSWLNAKAEPWYGVAGALWHRLAKDLGLFYREARPYSFMRRERSRGPGTAEIREAGNGNAR